MNNLGVTTVLALCSYGTVAAGQMVTITARPQRSFNGLRFGVALSCLGSFTIQDMRVGNMSLFPQSQDVSADAYVTPVSDLGLLLTSTRPDGVVQVEVGAKAESLLGRPFGWGWVEPSQDLVVMVTNVSGSACTFRSWVFGIMGGPKNHTVAIESSCCEGCGATLVSINGIGVYCPLCPT